MAHLRLGDTAPDFQAETTLGTITFHDWMGEGWAVLFSHPADFTPVCTTELGATARLAEAFGERHTRVAALSVDPLDQHRAWLKDIEDTQGARVGFPLIADPEGRIAALYGMLHPNESATATVRSLFIIGPDKRVKLIIAYPASTGRNFQEVLRVLDSLQLTAREQLATPADWRPGDPAIIIPAVSDADADARYPGRVRRVRPYLRYVDPPARTD